MIAFIVILALMFGGVAIFAVVVMTAPGQKTPSRAPTRTRPRDVKQPAAKPAHHTWIVDNLRRGKQEF